MSLPLAFALAWLTERTDLPGRRLLYTLMFVPMLLPPFAIALGWILLTSRAEEGYHYGAAAIA